MFQPPTAHYLDDTIGRLIAFCDTTHDIIVLDGALCFLDGCLEGAEAVTDRDGKLPATVIGRAKVTEVAVDGFVTVSGIAVEGVVGHEPYRQAVVFQERALQRGVIAIP